MVLNLVWDWYVLSPISCPHCPQMRRVSLEMRQACWLPVGIESKWLLYQESSHACYTHVFMHMFTQCTHDNFKLQPFLWHGFCRSSTLLSSRAHMWWVCLPSLSSQQYSWCVCCDIPGITYSQWLSSVNDIHEQWSQLGICMAFQAFELSMLL